MNNVEIILDYSYSLDGFQPAEVIALTFAEAEFNNLVTRGGTFSNRIKVGKTANNRQILGFPDENREQSSRPYTRFDCVIKVGGNPIFYGIAVLEQSQQFYELRIFSGLADFFKLLKDKALNELDLSAQNHDWTAANVFAATNATSNYCYPAIQYGRWSGTLSSRPHTDFFPAVFSKYLLETAAQEEGWTLNNYNEVYGIPFSKQDFKVNPVALFQLDNTVSIIGGLAGPFPLPDMNAQNDPSLHQISYTTSFGSGEGFEMRENGTYDFKAVIEYDCTLFGTVQGEIGIAEFRSSDNLFLRYVTGLTIISTSGTGEFTIFANGLSRSNPSTASYIAIQAGTFGVGSGSSFDLVDAKLECTSGTSPINSGDRIILKDTLPEIKVKDLFLFEAVRKNALIVPDPNTRTIEFVDFDTIAGRWGNARDWTDKVDLSVKPKYNYRLNDFARNNRLFWKEGSENEPPYRANNNLGNFNLIVDDEGLEEEKTMYTAPFAASAVVGSFTDNQHLSIIRYTDSSLAYNEPDNNPVERVCKLQSSTENLVQITSGGGTVTAQIQGTFDNWGTIVNDNYQSFTALLNRLKLVEVQVSLNAEDIAELDFTFPVKMLGNYWFLQEVRQWKANKQGTTTVKAIRL